MYSAFVTAALTAAVSTVVGSAVSAVIASLIARKRAKAIDEVTTARYIAIENGLQSILRAEIIRQHDKHTERGYCPVRQGSHGQGV